MIKNNNDSDNLNTPKGIPTLYRQYIVSFVGGLGWGTGIIISIVLFIIFIMYFVIRVQIIPKYDNELVVEEYYKHDAKFGDEMTRVQNAQDLPQKPEIINTSEGITIVFPAVFDAKGIKGKVSFYRPSDKKFDFEVPILLSNSSLKVPKQKLLGGRWDINMEWQYEGKLYLTKEVIYIE